MAARAPLLAVSSLRGADGVDDTAVKYLLRAELKKKKREEEEERKQELADGALDDKLEAELDALMAIGPLSTGSPAPRNSAGAAGPDREEEEEAGGKEEQEEEEEEDSQNLLLVLPRSSSTTSVVCPWLVLLVFLHLALCFFPSSAQDAPHHGRNAPEGQLPEPYRKIGLYGRFSCFFFYGPCI